MEPPSPLQALGVNPFPSRFIIRKVPRGDFAISTMAEEVKIYDSLSVLAYKVFIRVLKSADLINISYILKTVICS